MNRRMHPGLLLALTLLAGCAAGPAPVPQPGPRAADQPLAVAIVQAARAQLGAPYRYGGAQPGGFDCSGLVHYAHLQVGIAVPRTAAAQRVGAAPVAAGALRAGDLVFFRDGKKVSHVGIYVGDGRFVHAPGSGRRVTYGKLDDEYYRRRYAGAGRYH